MNLAVLLAVATAGGMAQAATYRYYRFSPSQLRNGVAEQFSEFRFYTNSSSATPSQVTYPTGTVASFTGGSAVVNDNEGPEKTIDGSLTTKWFNGGNGTSIAALVIDAGAGNTITADGYTFGTANDATDRDPVSWILEGSTDGTAWTTLDVRQNYATPTARNTLLPVLAIPASLSPYFSSFTAPTAVVKNGTTAPLSYTAMYATSVTISPTIGSGLPATTSTNTPIDPPDNADTTYTLTASSTAAPASPATKSFTIRSVAGGSVAYQEIRFTPLKSGGGIQLAEFNFYNAANTAVVPTSVVYDDGSDSTGAEGPDMLRDGNVATKWFSNDLKPIIFKFASTASIASYSFTTGGDTGTYPGRNPQQWTMEGRNGDDNWTLIENMTAFNYPVPAANNAVVTIPLPGASLEPIISDFYIQRDAVFQDQPTTAYFTTAGTGKVTLQPTVNGVAGTETEVLGTSAELTVTGPTVYTLRAYSANLQKVISKTISIGAPVTTAPATINYPNGFSTSGNADFAFNGNSSLTNDSFRIAQPGDVTRLRVIPDVVGQAGSIWFRNKVGVANGFDTTFGAQLSTPTRGYGAEGMAFVIQNTTDGTASLPDPAEKGPKSNAFVIELSTWDNGSTPPNEAKLRVLKGTADTTTEVTTVDLHTIPAAQAILRSQGYGSFTGDYTQAPYIVHVTYAGGALSVTIDGAAVLTNFPVDLGDAVDASGNAYVGFTARAGLWTQASDITSWTLTSGTTPAADLKITNSVFNVAGGTLALTFNSVSGTTYRVTHSSTLNGTDWTPIGSTVTANSASTTTTVGFTAGTKDFFRVEVAP